MADITASSRRHMPSISTSPNERAAVDLASPCSNSRRSSLPILRPSSTRKLLRLRMGRATTRKIALAECQGNDTVFYPSHGCQLAAWSCSRIPGDSAKDLQLPPRSDVVIVWRHKDQTMARSSEGNWRAISPPPHSESCSLPWQQPRHMYCQTGISVCSTGISSIVAWSEAKPLED